MANDKRDTLEVSTRNENIGGFIRTSGPVGAYDIPLPGLMTILMSAGTTSGIVAYKNSAMKDRNGNQITGFVPLIAGEKVLVQFTEILSAGSTVPVAELYWGVMAT